MLISSLLARLVSTVSLRSLVIAGFGLTVLPCFVAVLFSVLALKHLSQESKDTAYWVAQISERTQLLRKRLVDLERRAKQYAVLRDADSRESYTQTTRQVRQILNDLIGYSPETGFREQLEQVRAITDRLEGIVLPLTLPILSTNTLDASDDVTELLFDRLGMFTDDLGRRSAELIDRIVAERERETSAIQRRILWQTGFLVPASLVLISLFIYLITHPIRQLDQGIRQLGTGNLRDAIQVSGPKDLRYLGQRLEWLRGQLASLEQGKQHFVSNVSHELKTPLANIHEGATLLADQIVGEINAEQQGIVDIMLANTGRLEHLISELIHFGSANVAYYVAKRERVDLQEIVRSVVEDFELRVRSKSIHLRQDLHSAVTAGNREQLRLVVGNLLSNAVKYTPEHGEIEIILRESAGTIVLQVQDDGPGVRPEERGLVFEPFFRANPRPDPAIKGTGLGLAIVRECVASHQGRVDVIDAPSGRGGACFRVQLPVDPYA